MHLKQWQPHTPREQAHWLQPRFLGGGSIEAHDDLSTTPRTDHCKVTLQTIKLGGLSSYQPFAVIMDASGAPGSGDERVPFGQPALEESG